LSALTKIFVVLLVICSLLMAASVVVFVSRVENSRLTLERANQELETARRAQAAALNDANNLRAAAQAAEQQANARVAAISKDLATAQQQVADRGVQLADAQKNLALSALEVNRLTEGLKTSEATKAQLLAQTSQLRTTSDDVTKKNADLNSANSDLQNKLEVTERERRFLAEQITEAQNQMAKQASALKGAGIGSEEQLRSVKPAAPSIIGAVTAVKPIAGIPYATINVGTSASVAKGMEFNVIDREQGNFLGKITVDTVEPNEAVGRLEGPRVADVRPGNEVRTQL
jgi:hypothetical protein